MIPFPKRPNSWRGANLLAVLLLLSGATRLNAQNKPTPQEKAAIKQSLNNMPVQFEPNRGQAPKGVDFIARGLNYHLALSGKGAAFAFLQKEPLKQKSPGKHAPMGKITSVPLIMRLAGAKPASGVQGEATTSSTTHYLRGSDSSKWLHDVPSYGKVRYSDVYKGVDLLYYGTQKQLEYDFVVKPHANPNQIRLRFDGADKIKVAPSGELSLMVANREMKWRKPVAYQMIGGKRQDIASSYALDSGKQVSFQVAQYDKARPLVIDPVFAYSTYVSGGSEDECNDIAVDPTNKRVYVVGTTASRDFASFPNFLPSTAFLKTDWIRTYDDAPLATLDPNRTDYDAFVLMLDEKNNKMTRVIFGGVGNDTGNAIALGTPGNPNTPNISSVYVTGRTDSKFFTGALNAQPLGTDGNATDPNAPRGIESAYVVRLDFLLDYSVFPVSLRNPRIGWSMLIGGEDYDEGLDIAYRWNTTSATYGPFGSIAVVGVTTSHNLKTVKPFQAKPGSGEDGFLCVLRDMPDTAPKDAGKVVTTHYTYVGGIGSDYLTTVAIDNDFHMVLGGYTNSNNFPIKNAPTALAQPQGGYDGFVMRLRSRLDQQQVILFSTYLGGEADDAVYALALDSGSNIYVTGGTFSSEFPVTDNAEQSYLMGSQDAFVTKILTNNKIQYSSYLGGEEDDCGLGIAVTSTTDGIKTFVTGYSLNLPDALLPFPLVGAELSGQGGYDAFLTIYNSSWRMEGSTMMGGSDDDVAVSVATDSTGVFWWITGVTYSADYPAQDDIATPSMTANNNFNGGGVGTTDGFIARFVRESRMNPVSATSVVATNTITTATVNPTSSAPLPVKIGEPVTATVAFTSLVPKSMYLTYQVTDVDGKLYARDSILVNKGDQSSTFTVPLPVVKVDTLLTLTVSFVNESQSVQLLLTVPQLQDLTFPNDNLGDPVVFTGSGVTGMVVLDRPVVVDTVVTLKADTTNLNVPAKVVVKKGSNSAAVKFKANNITKDMIATVTATLGDTSQSRSILLLSTRKLSVTFNPVKVKGGLSDTVTVSIGDAIPAGWTQGLTVLLSATNNAALISNLPASVVIPGGSGQATFTAQTVATTGTAKSVTITGDLYGKKGSGILKVTP